jgi:hypothetical protein
MAKEGIARRSLVQAAALLVAGGAQAGGDEGEGLCPGLVGLTLRVVHPGDVITMDYREDRVTIEVDENEVIQRLSIG